MVQCDSTQSQSIALAGGSPADLLGEASRLFAAERYGAVRSLLEPAITSVEEMLEGRMETVPLQAARELS